MNDIYTLSDFADLTPLIKEPLKQTCRIKYTCFDASSNFVVFGAISGSLYLFRRNPCKFLHLIPSKHGPVSLLSISPNERYVAFATTKGTICVYLINLSPTTAPQLITTGAGETAVNYLHWSSDERQFYYGNRNGEVHLVTLTLFMGRTLLNLNVHPILFLDSPVVQIAEFESLLLVSNYTKCILCNTEYEEYKQIGNRPRDGYYGACFAISPNENHYASRIYCARPGSRLWEVDLEGNVVQTHQFKEMLACAPTNILKTFEKLSDPISDNADVDDDDIIYPPQVLQFAKLQTVASNFILTHTETGLYIFDPRTSSVVLWCNEFDRISDCKIIDNDILVFSSSGSLVSVRLNTLQHHAIDLVKKTRLSECAHFLRTNLKYFAEKAREQYDLHVLGEIKSYLISNNQYELLNDLSVIFDSINQNDEDSTVTPSKRPDTKSRRLSNGVYILENAFCENLKIKSNSDKHFKDALLTVTGKFGKNIIKYKFNIFAEDQKNLVNDLIPNERSNPFKEINDRLEIDDDIVCSRIKDYAKSGSVLAADNNVLSEERKTIYNLFMIFKSSKISNVNFLDRYSSIFDKYDSREIIDLLKQLKDVMIENGDNETEAKKNCYEMYFNYLNPEIIWEVDAVSQEFIIDGFMLVNRIELRSCDSCAFPLEIPSSCRFYHLGEVLIRFLWSRNEQSRCLEILKAVPSVIEIICRFYIQENQIAKAIPIALNYTDASLLQEAGKSFDLNDWDMCFAKFAAIQRGQLNCINCDRQTTDTETIDRNRFFDWNYFLDVALHFNRSLDVLNLVIKYSNVIPNNAIDRTFFLKCLLSN